MAGYTPGEPNREDANGVNLRVDRGFMGLDLKCARCWEKDLKCTGGTGFPTVSFPFYYRYFLVEKQRDVKVDVPGRGASVCTHCKNAGNKECVL